MKKLIAKTLIIIMALITLPACSQNPAPAASESPAASDISLPTPPPSPSPTLVPKPICTYESVVLPDYIPPTGFEVDSVWRAEPFGDQGGALIYMSDIADGVFLFKLYMYQYIHEQDSIDRGMNLCTITAAANYNGEKYIFSADRGSNEFIGLDSLTALYGAFSFSGDKIALEYNDAEYRASRTETAEFKFDDTSPSICYEGNEWEPGNYTTFLPVTFTRVPEDEAGSAMYEMPMFLEEVQLPPSAAVSLDAYYSSNDPDQIPMLRNVTLGDNIIEVITRFRCELEDYNDLAAIAPENGDVMFYGSLYFFPFSGRMVYENAVPKEIRYVYGGDWITFFLDEKQCVCEIRFTMGA